MPLIELRQRCYFFTRPGGLRFGIVFVALDRSGLAYVNIVFPEREPIGPIEILDQRAPVFTACDVGINPHTALSLTRTIGDQHLSICTQQHETRDFEISKIFLCAEPLRELQLRALGALDHPRIISRGWSRVRRGQIVFMLPGKRGGGENTAREKDGYVWSHQFYFNACKNSMSKRFTSSGLSCCVQCPTPGSRTFFLKFGILTARLS